MYGMYWIRHLSPGGALAMVIILAISIAARETDNKFRGLDQDIIEVGRAPETWEEAGASIGFRYSRAGIFDIDVWRWDGHPVVYVRLGGGYAEYRDLTDDEIAEIGFSTPWRYHFPEGLLALACIAELLIVSRRKRTVRFALIAGGVIGAFALVLRAGGLTWEAVFPGLVAVHHLGTGIAALWASRHDEPEEDLALDDPADPSDPRPARPSTPPRVHAAVDANPFRAPPQPQPVVVRATTAPAVIPVAHDPNAETPKLLT